MKYVEGSVHMEEFSSADSFSPIMKEGRQEERNQIYTLPTPILGAECALESKVTALVIWAPAREMFPFLQFV